MAKFLLPLIYILSITAIIAQNSPAKTNISHFYTDGSEIQINFMYTTTGEFYLNYYYPVLESIEVYLQSYRSLNSKNPEEEQLLYAKCTEQGCKLSLSYRDLEGGLVHLIRFTDLNNEESFLFPVHKNPQYLSDVKLINAIDEWIPNNYLLTGTEVYLSSFNGNPITVQIYSDPFDPADPPTGNRKPSKKELKPQRVFTLSDGELLELNETGLYLLQTDEKSMNGLTFRVEDQPFPRYNRLEELGNSMIYLTTREEQNILKSGNLNKKIFDDIWLNMSGTETVAKAAIRDYFRGVQSANKLFTTYKEGWKTDKGMIYIAFGPPDEVFLTESGEEWRYNSTDIHDDITFTFLDLPTVFSPDHSILQRDKKYALPWNSTIDRMRRGITNYE